MIWRLVEAQHVVSTLKLVETLAEQALLEELLEKNKPAIPADCRHLDYLLSAPFRYTPYPKGSRFRRTGLTRGIFYGSVEVTTAVAEMAFYRLLFHAESPATPFPANPAEMTGFSASISARRLTDLTRPPFDADEKKWTHASDYEACQALADTVRAKGSDAIRYHSVRDPSRGDNIAVLDCTAFAQAKIGKRETWRMAVSQSGVIALREFPRKSMEFPIKVFAADSRLSPFLPG